MTKLDSNKVLPNNKDKDSMMFVWSQAASFAFSMFSYNSKCFGSGTRKDKPKSNYCKIKMC